MKLLIEPYGIEITDRNGHDHHALLLIEPYGIEIGIRDQCPRRSSSF